MNLERRDAMNAGRMNRPTIRLALISKIISELISVWKSRGENSHGSIPPTITAYVASTHTPVVRSAVVIASFSMGRALLRRDAQRERRPGKNREAVGLSAIDPDQRSPRPQITRRARWIKRAGGQSGRPDLAAAPS